VTKLYDGEPVFDEPLTLSDVAEVAAKLINADAPGVQVIAIDGRSGGGKTTLANALAVALGATVLHTDDFAWWHSLFDWPQMIIDNALMPLRAGRSIDYRPDAWVEREREGSIVAKPSRFVIVEGVGAGQLAMRPQLDVVIWVQTDADEAKRRGVERDLAERPDPAEAERFWNEWQAAENPFQATQQTWAVADFVFRGF
jgi:uridine kinase